MRNAGATLGGAMLECAFTVNRMAEQLGRVYQLSAREVLAVMELAIGGPRSARELGDCLYVTRSAMTSMVRRLETAGWIESEPDEVDRRRLVLRATDRPRRLLEIWFEWFQRGIDERVAHDAMLTQASISGCADVLDAQRAWLASLGPAEVRAIAEGP